MKFNYASEKRKYDRRWKTLEKEYRRAGMTDSDINAMKEFDWEQFKKERVFCRHNQYIPESVVEGEVLPDDQSSLLGKYIDRFATYIPEYVDCNRYGWVETVENKELYEKLKSLSVEKLELLTLYVIEERSQEEVGKILGIGHSAVSRRFTRITSNIKKD